MAMFGGRLLKDCCAVGAGGDHPGQRVLEVREPQDDVLAARTPCRRLARATTAKSLVASLQKSHGCGPRLPPAALLGRGPAAAVPGGGRLRSRSVGDLSYFVKPHARTRRGGTPAAMEVAGGRGPAAASGALRACLLLMLNAWRGRREETRLLRARLDQMRLQVTTLRALNKQEADRACRAHLEAGRARAHCDALRQQLDALRADDDGLRAANAALEARLADQTTAAQNLRNDLQAARLEAAALDAQLAKERDKLAAARADRERLRAQVDEKCAQLEDADALLLAARSDVERASLSAELTDGEVSRLSTRCRELEEALECEQHAASQAQQAADEHAQELRRARALLELERTPRRSAHRLLEVLRAPLGLLNAIYEAVCPHPLHPYPISARPSRAPL